jgi:hypothetical protein
MARPGSRVQVRGRLGSPRRRSETLIRVAGASRQAARVLMAARGRKGRGNCARSERVAVRGTSSRDAAAVNSSWVRERWPRGEVQCPSDGAGCGSEHAFVRAVCAAGGCVFWCEEDGERSDQLSRGRISAPVSRSRGPRPPRPLDLDSAVTPHAYAAHPNQRARRAPCRPPSPPPFPTRGPGVLTPRQPAIASLRALALSPSTCAHTGRWPYSRRTIGSPHASRRWTAPRRAARARRAPARVRPRPTTAGPRRRRLPPSTAKAAPARASRTRFSPASSSGRRRRPRNRSTHSSIRTKTGRARPRPARRRALAVGPRCTAPSRCRICTRACRPARWRARTTTRTRSSRNGTTT